MLKMGQIKVCQKSTPKQGVLSIWKKKSAQKWMKEEETEVKSEEEKELWEKFTHSVVEDITCKCAIFISFSLLSNDMTSKAIEKLMWQKLHLASKIHIYRHKHVAINIKAYIRQKKQNVKTREEVLVECSIFISQCSLLLFQLWKMGSFYVIGDTEMKNFLTHLNKIMFNPLHKHLPIVISIT